MFSYISERLHYVYLAFLSIVPSINKENENKMNGELYIGQDFYDDIGGEDRHLDASYESRFEFLDDYNDELHYSECPYCDQFECVCESDLIE